MPSLSSTNGTLVVTTEEARAFGLNAATGRIIWQRKFGTGVSA
jgi:outer membrane protein assembly factor BamB